MGMEREETTKGGFLGHEPAIGGKRTAMRARKMSAADIT